MRLALSAAVALALLMLAGEASAAGFDCAKAATRVEKTICADPGLSARDEAMALAYRQALSRPEDAVYARQTQREWLKARDGLRTVAALTRSYDERLQELVLGGAGLGGKEYARTDGHGDLTLRPLANDWFMFALTAVWVGNVDLGNVHTGESAGVFKVVNGQAAWTYDGCRLSFRSVSPGAWTVTTGPGCYNGGQWGMNVTMDGTYRARR